MRLIDADKLKQHYAWWNNEEQRTFDQIVDAQPTVDAVPVVRCRECKHRDPEDHKCDCGHAILWQLPREDDWFCADGERKDGAE